MKQLYFDGFCAPIRLARNKNGTVIKPFVREDFTVKRMSSDAAPIEGFYVEMNS